MADDQHKFRADRASSEGHRARWAAARDCERRARLRRQRGILEADIARACVNFGMAVLGAFVQTMTAEPRSRPASGALDCPDCGGYGDRTCGACGGQGCDDCDAFGLVTCGCDPCGLAVPAAEDIVLLELALALEGWAFHRACGPANEVITRRERSLLGIPDAVYIRAYYRDGIAHIFTASVWAATTYGAVVAIGSPIATHHVAAAYDVRTGDIV